MRQYFTKDKDGRFVSGAASPEASHAKYLLWLDTYNAALTGLLAGSHHRVDDKADYHAIATALANELHGEQS